MAKNYWKIVNDVVRTCDILVIVADARVPDSVNTEVLRKINKDNKKHIIIFNKIDLLDENQKKTLREKMKEFEFSMQICAKDHKNTMVLLRRLNAMAQGKKADVGVVGYPNTGKSSLINAIKGSHSASVSSQAGHTKGLQKLRATGKIMLLDTPGVIPYDNKDLAIQGMFSARSPNQMQDPEGAVMKLIDYCDGKIESHYGVKINKKDVDQTLDNIAEKLNIKKKNGEVDTKRAAVHIIHDWQKGRI